MTEQGTSAGPGRGQEPSSLGYAPCPWGESAERRTEAVSTVSTPGPDLARYDQAKLNAVANAVGEDVHWTPLSTRYRIACRALDALGLGPDAQCTPALPRRITPDEVQVGDRVRWECANGTTVEGPIADTDHGSMLPLRFAGMVWLDLDGGTLTLLARPLPPIPTDEGTVLRRKGSGVLMVWVTDRAWVFIDGRGAYAGTEPTREDWDVLVPDGLS